MPFAEGDQRRPIEGKFTRDDEGIWRCESCDYTTDNYQSILGHQTKHSSRSARGNPYGYKGKIRMKDPMDMTINELIATLEELRNSYDELEKSAKEALAWKEKMQALFSNVTETE